MHDQLGLGSIFGLAAFKADPLKGNPTLGRTMAEGENIACTRIRAFGS